MTDMIKQVKPKIITLQTPCIRNQRTLVWLQKQTHTSWKKWDAIVTSLEDYDRWSSKATIVGIILDTLKQHEYEHLFAISSHVPMILLSRTILSTKPEEYWTDNYDNLVCLDDMVEQYPYLGHAWDNSTEDAIGLFAYLHRYNRIVDCDVPMIRFHRFQENCTLERGIVPPMIWLVAQYFRHSDEARAREIMETLKQNTVCADIGTIVLLTERDYSKDWRHIQTKKIQQIVIGKRLTYAHFLQYVKERVPKNTIVMLANADIFFEDLSDLWKINMKSVMLSLLRWDVKEDSDPELFGPRADSQDTWIVLSDSVKEVTWKYEPFDIQLGKPGCDNIFAGLMLRNHFVLYNPALTLKTYHLHLTAIRNYNNDDVIRASLYVNIVPGHIIDTKQETPVHTIATFSNEVVSFEVQSSSLSNEIAYCTMLEKEGRYKWEASVENFYFDEISVYQWDNACVTPNGLVYTPYRIYPGDDQQYPYWNASTVTIYTPLQQTEQMIAIPLPSTTLFMSSSEYVLYYLSRVLRFLTQYPHASFWIPEPYHYCLSTFGIQSTPLIVSNTTACYAKQVIGYLPGANEIGKEEITILRDRIPQWIASPVYKRCVIVGEFHHKKQLSELLCKEWFIEYIEEATIDAAVGTSLCIVTTPLRSAWASLWALPKHAFLIEFQQELEINGELQHLAHVSELRSWVLLLSKGSQVQVQKQLMKLITMWFIVHEEEIEKNRMTK
jgi:hypothetical protein